MLLALVACAAPGAREDRAVADTIQAKEIDSGTGPTAGVVVPDGTAPKFGKGFWKPRPEALDRDPQSPSEVALQC